MKILEFVGMNTYFPIKHNDLEKRLILGGLRIRMRISPKSVKLSAFWSSRLRRLSKPTKPTAFRKLLIKHSPIFALFPNIPIRTFFIGRLFGISGKQKGGCLHLCEIFLSMKIQDPLQNSV